MAHFLSNFHLGLDVCHNFYQPFVQPYPARTRPVAYVEDMEMFLIGLFMECIIWPALQEAAKKIVLLPTENPRYPYG